MKVKVQIIDRDFGWKEIKKDIAELKRKPFVKIGIHGQSAMERKQTRTGVDPDATLVDVATFNEYGTSTIPERSFIRATHDRNEKKYEDRKRRYYDAILGGKINVLTALKLIGEEALADIRRTITRSIGIEKNAPSTIAAKGSSRPLVDTGQLTQGLDYAVVMDGKETKD